MRIKKEIHEAMAALNVLGTFTRRIQQARTAEQLQAAIDTTKDEAKRNYREQIQRLHPDKAGGDEESAKALTAAYNEIKSMQLMIEQPPPPPRPVIHVVFTHNGFTTSTSTSTSTSTFWF